MSDSWKNWSKTAECRPRRTEHPASAEEISAALGRAKAQGLRVKVVGSGHSFGDIAATDGVHLVLDRLNRFVGEDRSSSTVTVEGGMTLSTLNSELDRRGLAMANLGDIEYQTVAGAIATGTHGSGIRYGPLSSQVESLKLVLADGSVAECSRTDREDLFLAALNAIGALGVIVEVTLEVVPSFLLRQTVVPTTLEDLEDRLQDELAANDHFDFMYDFTADGVAMRRTNPVPAGTPTRPRWRAVFDDLLIGNLAQGLVFAFNRKRPERIAGHSARLPASTRADFVDRSFRVFTAPRRWPLVAGEYSVPAEAAIDAVTELGGKAREAGIITGFPLFVRYVAGDDGYLSPSEGRDSAFICPIQLKPLPLQPYLGMADEVMRGYGARPHWGKLHEFTHEDLKPLYPKWGEFQRVRATVDPDGLFGNEHLDRVLGPVRAPGESQPGPR